MINIGIGIGWAKALYSVANNVIANFKARVATYPGSIFEAGPCLDATLEELNAIGLLDNVSLVITPNAYNETKLYDVIPNTTLGDMDVVRATTATRVNELGLIEVVPRNLLTYSLNLSSGYTQNQCTIGASQTDPFGTSNAKRITNAAVVTDPYFEQSISFSPNTYTWSIYVKQGTALTATIRPVHVGIGGDVSVMTFTFATETIVTSGVITTSGFTKLTNGWYRIYCSVNVTSAVSSLRGRFGNPSVANVYNDWAFPQLEVSSTATTFFPTTTRLNIPRIDYTNGSCPSLLVEPQRTNLLTYSNEFSNASWVLQNLSITTNTVTAPNGLINASSLTGDGLLNFKRLFKNISFTSGIAYTISVYAKANTNNFIQLLFGGAGFTDFAFANFNIANGTIGTIGTAATATITNAGDGWYRCTMTATAIASTTTLSGMCLITSATSIRSESNTLSTSEYIWGAQLEAGSYATSYIPTVASTVTRNADVISKTGISSLIGQTEGTLFTDFVCNGFQNYGTPLSVNNSSTSNNIWITTFANGNIRAELYNGAVQASIIYTGGVIGQRYKLAFAYKTNDFAMYVNGSLVGTDVSGTTFSGTTLSRLDFDLGNSALYSLSLIKVNQVILFPNRLTNSELAQLTTI